MFRILKFLNLTVYLIFIYIILWTYSNLNWYHILVFLLFGTEQQIRRVHSHTRVRAFSTAAAKQCRHRHSCFCRDQPLPPVVSAVTDALSRVCIRDVRCTDVVVVSRVCVVRVCKRVRPSASTRNFYNVLFRSRRLPFFIILFSVFECHPIYSWMCWHLASVYPKLSSSPGLTAEHSNTASSHYFNCACSSWVSVALCARARFATPPSTTFIVIASSVISHHSSPSTSSFVSYQVDQVVLNLHSSFLLSLLILLSGSNPPFILVCKRNTMPFVWSSYLELQNYFDICIQPLYLTSIFLSFLNTVHSKRFRVQPTRTQW